MPITVEEHLKSFREAHGEEAWKSEVHRLALAGIRAGSKHESFWRELTKDFDWLNWDEIKAQAGSTQATQAPDQMLAEILRRQMPGIKTQAQYDAVLGTLDAVRLVVNAILVRDPVQEATARKALETTFEAARAATEMTSKLEDSPEAATSKAAEQFKQPPLQFQETEILESILSELNKISNNEHSTLEALDAWYAITKDKRDRVVSQSLRNKMMDAIRAAKLKLQG